MAIEREGQEFCMFVFHENGRVMHRRVHEMVAQATDGRTIRLKGKVLPDSIILLSGKSEDGKHLAEVLCDPRFPRPRLFDLIFKPKMRDFFYMWLGACIVICLILSIAMLVLSH